MLEYSINVRTDGSAAIARDKWNKEEDFEHRNEKPFLFEVGQKVVDIFSNVVTITEILKYPPSKPGCCPEWNIRVAENGNTYRYTEIAGIFVREVSKEELAEIISGLHIVVEKGTDGSEMKVINHPNRAFKQRVKELLRMYGESNNDNIHEINAALDHLKRMICP